MDSFQTLQDICRRKLNDLFRDGKFFRPALDYISRLEYELEVFKNSGYSSIILIIREYIQWARSNGIVVGPGRGSAAGSLVVYLSGITTIDPLRFGLIFERFLNPSRVSLPDIDTDFSDRDAVIQHLKDLYGENRVIKVGVPSLFKPRSAVDEFGRVLDIPFPIVKKINKLITEKTLEASLKAHPELQEYIEKNPKLFELVPRVLGCVRHTSTHPSAVILTEGPIGREIPLTRSRDHKDELVTQWDGEDLDYLGFVKLDILTVNNLSVIHQTLQMLPKEEREKFDIYDLDLTDKDVLAAFNRGETLGVFQFEEPKSRRILTQIKDIQFIDLVNANALIRPGINVGKFLKGRNNPALVTYIIPELKPILRHSFGVILFQEQVMKICQQLAGFSLSEADKVRKIIAKTANQSDPKGLSRVKEKFREGYIKNGLPIERFDHIWSSILACQTYIFNLAHSTSYAMISYMDMFLKVHYPKEFMCALLRYKFEEKYVQESIKMGIPVLPPCIQRSDKKAKLEEADGVWCIRAGLQDVKHVGNIKPIIQGRPYRDFNDVINRSKIRANVLHSLVYAGAFDIFEPREKIISRLYGDQSYVAIAQMEKEALGLYLKFNPLKDFEDKFKKCWTPSKQKMKQVKLGGLIKQLRVIEARTGTMAFLQLEIFDYEIETVIWPDDYRMEGHKLAEGNIIIADGFLTKKMNYCLKNIEVLHHE